MNKFLLLASLSVALSAPAFADDGLPFNLRLNDDVATAKSKLKTSLEPEDMPRNPTLPANVPDITKGKTVLHLRTKGVWVFFDRDGKLETIRLDAPFGGSIKGVKVGDSEKTLLAALGKPITKPGPAMINLTAYKYVLDDSAYVTYDLNDDGVQIIFITK